MSDPNAQQPAAQPAPAPAPAPAPIQPVVPVVPGQAPAPQFPPAPAQPAAQQVPVPAAPAPAPGQQPAPATIPGQVPGQPAQAAQFQQAPAADINTIINEVEADAKLKETALKQEMQNMIDSRMAQEKQVKDQEIAGMQGRIDAIKAESQTQINNIVNEYRTKLSEVDSQLSQRTSVVPQTQNPFRADPNQGPLKSLHERKDLSDADKIGMFRKTLR